MRMLAMYAPVPPRPKKTNITRTRGGCESCRRRRRKCDQGRPRCERCIQTCATCSYTDSNFEFRDVRRWAECKVRKVRGDRLIQSQYSGEHAYTTTRPHTEINIGDAQPEETYPSHTDVKARTTHVVTVSSLNAAALMQIDSTAKHTMLESDVWHRHSRDDFLGFLSSKNDPRITCASHEIGSELVTHQHHGSHAATSLSPHIGGQYQIPRQLDNCPSLVVSERYYLWYFENKLFERIPPYLEIIKSVAMGSDIIISALMALSAADLAVSLGNYVESSQTNRSMIWAPKRPHRLAAYQYVEKSLSLITAPAGSDIRSLLVTHLVLLLVELSLGTFSSLRSHIHSIDALVRHNSSRLQSTRDGKEILRAIANVRLVIKPMTGVREPAEEKGTLWADLKANICLPSVILQNIGTQAMLVSQRFRVLVSLKQSLRQRDDLFELMKDLANIMLPSSMFCSGGTVPSESKIKKAIHAESILLGDLRQSLLTMSWSFGKISMTGGTDWTDLSNTDSDVARSEIVRLDTKDGVDLSPIYFDSQDKAIEAVYYAFCHIMCDQELLNRQDTYAPLLPVDSTAMSYQWLKVLLRTIKGMPTPVAVENDFYRRGFSWLIFQAADICNSVEGFNFLEEHMIRIKMAGKAGEDLTFPTHAWTALIPIFRHAIQGGRRIVALEESPALASRFSIHETVLSGKVPAELIEHGIDADGQPYKTRIVLR